MNLRERIQYYLEIIRYYIKNNIIFRWMFWFGGNFLILYLCMKASKINRKYFNYEMMKHHNTYLNYKKFH